MTSEVHAEAVREAQRRLDWSARHIEVFNDSFAAWDSANDTRLVGALDKDREGLDVRIEGLAPAPTDDWGFILGDVAHNLRSTLDNLLHSIAIDAGVDEKIVKRLQFPVCATAEDWSKKDGGLHKVRAFPDEIVEVIEAAQPFNRPGPKGQAIALAILFELNNADKHRVALRSDLSSTSATFDITAHLMDETATNAPDGEIVLINSADVLAHIHVGQPVKSITVKASVDMSATVFDKFGRRFEVGTIMHGMLQDVTAIAGQLLMVWEALPEQP